MTVKQAAEALEVKPTTVYDLCAAGLLGHIRIGCGRGTIRIEQSDIDAYKEKARIRKVPKMAEEPSDPYLKHVTLPPRN